MLHIDSWSNTGYKLMAQQLHYSLTINFCTLCWNVVVIIPYLHKHIHIFMWIFNQDDDTMSLSGNYVKESHTFDIKHVTMQLKYYFILKDILYIYIFIKGILGALLEIKMHCFNLCIVFLSTMQTALKGQLWPCLTLRYSIRYKIVWFKF